jgi:hypothetical protein
MNWSKTLLAVALLLVGLFFAPVFPTSFFFGVSASLYGAENVHDAVGLSETDVDEIVAIISDHQSFGSDTRYPRTLSLKQYVFDFENVGFNGIGLMPLGFEEDCLDCSAAAFSSVTRDASDAASTMYFLAKEDGDWQIREVRDGVTGKPLAGD